MDLIGSPNDARHSNSTANHENQRPETHKKRLIFLTLAEKTVLEDSDLTLTKIGRDLDTDPTVKHAIKRIDRLLGNRNLHREKESVYKWHTSFITRANPLPWFWLIGRMFESNYAIRHYSLSVR